MPGRWLFGGVVEDFAAGDGGGDLVRVEEVVSRTMGYDGASDDDATPGSDEEDGAGETYEGGGAEDGDGDGDSTASLSFVTAAHDACAGTGQEGEGDDGEGEARVGVGEAGVLTAI